ncbi:hypothetical protein Bbelb_100400 [Branchiostoma belcheri]|nr:hypothetical protein Bbelb_100400 [Branchiostoma belcheri]
MWKLVWFGVIGACLLSEGVSSQTLCESLTGDSGYFNSTNYPDNYPDDHDCKYEISVTPPKVIKLTFTDFDVEKNYDFVYVYEGSTTNSTFEIDDCLLFNLCPVWDLRIKSWEFSGLGGQSEDSLRQGQLARRLQRRLSQPYTSPLVSRAASKKNLVNTTSVTFGDEDGMLCQPTSRGTLQGRATPGPGGPEPRTGGQDRRQRQADLDRRATTRGGSEPVSVEPQERRDVDRDQSGAGRDPETSARDQGKTPGVRTEDRTRSRTETVSGPVSCGI